MTQQHSWVSIPPKSPNTNSNSCMHPSVHRASVTVSKIQRQPECPSADEGTQKPGRTHVYTLYWLPRQLRGLPAQEIQQMRVRSLVREDPLEEEMATHSTILAWEIPWTEKPGGLQSVGSRRGGHTEQHMGTHTHMCTHTRTHMHMHTHAHMHMCTHVHTHTHAHTHTCTHAHTCTRTHMHTHRVTTCAVLSLVAQSCSTLCNPMDCSLPGTWNTTYSAIKQKRKKFFHLQQRGWLWRALCLVK